MSLIKFSYNSSVFVSAGWRPIRITALGELSASGKMVTVINVLAIDGDLPVGYLSRTGANRQRYNAQYIANRELGARKRLSSCELIAEF